VRKLYCIMIMFVGLIIPALFAQGLFPEEESIIYGKALGSQIFEINLGLGIPLFSFPSVDGGLVPGANLKVGGMGSFKWASFLNESLSLGIDIGGFVSEGPNASIFTSFPLGLRLSNYFRLADSLQLPVHLGLGVNYMRYRDTDYIGFIVKPGFGIYWDASKDWAFGLNIAWWLMPELYAGLENAPPQNHTRFGNVLEVTLSALYSFNN
jgi:hypothetical protein